MQGRSNDRLRLLTFGHRNGMDSVFSVSDPSVATDKIDEICPLHQQLRHSRIVVVGLREVTIAADLCLTGADRVWNECAEGMPAVAIRGDCLLLRVEPFAVLVLRTDQDSASRSSRCNPPARYCAVLGQHKDVIAESLEIVLRVIAQFIGTLVVKHRFLPVGDHRQVTPEATGRPRCMTGVTGHIAVGVRQGGFVSLVITPALAVPLDGFRVGRGLAVTGFTRGDGVDRLDYVPKLARFDQRVLNDLSILKFDILTGCRMLLSHWPLRSRALEQREFPSALVTSLELGQVFIEGDYFSFEASSPGCRS